MIDFKSYKIYKDFSPSRKKLNLQISIKFFQQTKLFFDSNYHHVKHCVTVDVMMFLMDIFKDDYALIYDNKEQGILFPDYISRIFQKVNQDGLYITETDYSFIKRNLHPML